MISTFKRLIASLLALMLFVGAAPLARAASPAVPAPPAPPTAASSEDGEADDSQNPAPTPPRLSYINGEVSFWRPGGEDWAPAQVNTPLAPGDQLYTGNRGNLEVQIDSRSFVRAWGDSQLGLENHEPDFLQIKVAAGHVSLDLRTLDGGRSVELDTPAAAFTIDRPGYYRVDVAPDRTSFVTRRGGTASTTTSPAPTATASPPNFNSPTLSPAIANSRSSCPNWIEAPLSCSSLIAGSTSTALRPSRAISGRQACPPASSVSRTIAPASPADPSGGSTFSAASSSGCTSRW